MVVWHGKLPSKVPAPPMRNQIVSQLFHLWSSFLLLPWERKHKVAQLFGPLPLMGETRRAPGLLFLAWLSPATHGWDQTDTQASALGLAQPCQCGNQRTEGAHPTPLLSLCLIPPFKWINKSLKERERIHNMKYILRYNHTLRISDLF